jgi:hypothetical protein
MLCKYVWMKKECANGQDMYEMKKGSMCEEGMWMKKACVDEEGMVVCGREREMSDGGREGREGREGGRRGKRMEPT